MDATLEQYLGQNHWGNTY